MKRIIFCCYIAFVSTLFGQIDTLHFRDTDSVSTVKFSAVGDLMCHATQLRYAQVDSNLYDFKPCFEKVKPIFEESDFVIGNLETVVAGEERGYLGYPVFNTPVEYLEALKYAGFDLLITANNHATDQGREGIINTAANIKMSRLNYSGTNLFENDTSSVQILRSNGISFAVLSYTYGINLKNLERDEMFMVNFIDTDRIRRDINRARNADAEIVILFFHFGKEYADEPNEYQRNIVRKSIEYGADIIIGSHPHSLQPIEFYETNNANIDTGFVAYSLGNFISNQRWRFSDCGVILNFEFEKNVYTNKIRLSSVDYIPTWVFKGNNGRENLFEILPTSKYNFSGSLNYLSEEDILLMEQSLIDTREILNRYTNKSAEVFFSSDTQRRIPD